MSRTKVDEELAQAERQHAGDEERAELLARARRFKSSWLELAEALAETRKGARWKRWGFGSFEEYTRRELHLRQETVDKLTGSYTFLKSKAPEVLARDGVGDKIPSFQAVDFWRRAEEQEGAPKEALAEIRGEVIDQNASLPALSRKYREVVFPIAPDEKRDREAAALKGAARRLAELLGSTHAVPKRLAGEVKEAVEKLVDALTHEDAEAA